MGKARILSAQGEGLYSIEILEDRTRAESRKALSEQRITQIDSELTDLEQDLDDAQQAVDDGAAAQDQAIADYQAEPTDESRQAMQEHAAKLITLAEARDAVRLTIANLNLERLTLQTTISSVEALPALRQQDAWCADYTEDLSGEVATAEVPGEIGQVIIKPGFEGANQWSPSADGAMQPALASTPAGVFYSLAMMPGWQKWRPTFRIATISNIDNDLCDIALDPATSSQQGLNVNAQGSYAGVPIMYMDCNGDAFEDGDRVLVAFSGNTEQPMVVGFEREPRICSLEFFTRHSTWWAQFGSNGPVGDYGSLAHALVFQVDQGFDVRKILHERAVNRNFISGFALCRLSQGLEVDSVLYVRWVESGDDPFFTEETLANPISLEEGAHYALLSIVGLNAFSALYFEFTGFNYSDFAAATASHITVIQPSSELQTFMIPLPRATQDVQETRQLFLDHLPGASVIEQPSTTPNPMPGLGLNADRYS